MRMNFSKYLLLLLLLAFLGFVGCHKKYVFQDTIELSEIPSAEKTIAIALMDNCIPPHYTSAAKIMVLIGDQNTVEEKLGYKINPNKIITDRKWIEKLIYDFKNAERTKKGYTGTAAVGFFTKRKAYIVPMAKHDEIIYGPDYESKKLKKDFDELGLN